MGCKELKEIHEDGKGTQKFMEFIYFLLQKQEIK
jgi:hypothetical protein